MEIISTINVETQEQLLKELQNAGFRSTQATISRDIKELRIVKELTAQTAPELLKEYFAWENF